MQAVVLRHLCAVKILQQVDDFRMELELLQRMADDQRYSPELLECTAIADGELHAAAPRIVMERGVVSLDERITAASPFAVELLAPLDLVGTTPLQPAEAFRKSFLVQNVGTATWDGSNVRMAVARRNTLGAVEWEVPYAASGDTVDVCTQMTAPIEEGEYTGA